MGKYMRKCKVIGEVAVMAELGHVGVKTRARTLAMAEAASAAKRTKIDSGELKLEFSSSFNQVQNNRRLMITPEIPNSPATSPENSGVVPSHRCYSNGSCDLVSGSLRKSLQDLEGEGFKFEISSRYFFDRRASDLSNPEFNELESTAGQSEAHCRSSSKTTAVKMPTEVELEDFFSAFEKAEQKRFEEKYNYDFVKDVPLEGRYKWIPLKQ